MEPITKTNFLGVVIDTEKGSSNPKINKALNYSFQDLENISIDEEELIEAMKVINDQKYDV